VVDVRTYAVANPPPHGGRSWIFVRLTTGEGIETWGGFHAEILREPIRWENGYIIPPTKPGLGVELNEEVAADHPAF